MENGATTVPRPAERKYAETHERKNATTTAIGQNARAVSGIRSVRAQARSAGVIW